ncbi:conserved hypothetical protein [Candidatus Methylobacter favarea]|uniref:Cupin type-2 domain-containing protein n=1 Tax=Candidatus Methylobacter favarea TaxID=2707345 RepID=A0A8S0WSJ7_9GAMM|nr:cupin domain-containing protein [Candidatus Methylobacter favarea]CAA9892831.1 conserved hypothetical protein [Candidatus Methylobacter favarea]
MKPLIPNIYSRIPEDLPGEMVECLLKRDHISIERIISKGHITTPGQWYDQAWDEWVMVLQGRATLQYENDKHSITLTAGDYWLIPAHARHRVAWTQPDIATLWLVIHLNKPTESIFGTLPA